MKLNDKVYDVLKWIVMVVLPAIGTFYAALSGVWGWPMTQEVTTTIAAVTAFLGILLGISTAEYRAQKIPLEDTATADAVRRVYPGDRMESGLLDD